MPLLPSSSSKAFRKTGLHGREGALGHAKQLDKCDSGGYVRPLLLYMVLFSVGHIFVKVQEKKKTRKTLRSARAKAIWLYGKGDFRILVPFLVSVFRVFGWILCPIIHHPKNLIDGYDRPTLWSHLEGRTPLENLQVGRPSQMTGTETANGPHSPWCLPQHAQENKPLDHNIKYQTGAKSDPVSMATHTHHSGVWKSEAFCICHLGQILLSPYLLGIPLSLSQLRFFLAVSLPWMLLQT